MLPTKRTYGVAHLSEAHKEPLSQSAVFQCKTALRPPQQLHSHKQVLHHGLKEVEVFFTFLFLSHFSFFGLAEASVEGCHVLHSTRMKP